MAILIDNPEYTSDEIYEIQQTDAVEGAAVGATFSGIGIANQPHQQLANRTSFLKQRQDTNIANISVLQAFEAGFTGSLQGSGYLKIPLSDIQRGSVAAIIQWGYYSLTQVRIAQDSRFTVSWPIRFPSAILIPPLATNYYFKTGGMNTVVSVVSYDQNGGTFVLDVPGDMYGLNGATAEITNGFSWLAIGF
jgi:hypothetical protein